MKKRRKVWLLLMLVLLLALTGCGGGDEMSSSADADSAIASEAADDAGEHEQENDEGDSAEDGSGDEDAGRGDNDRTAFVVDLDEIPPYSGDPYIILNKNIPGFQASDLADRSYEAYGKLDYLGRCTVADANLGQDLMPTEERTSISHIKPTGWQLAKYDFVDGKYLYNRCHLIGFQLSGENDNERNLITGTRYMNLEMLYFEDMVADYIRETDNHVRYRVTPIYDGTNPLASGIQMEGMSVEDNGEDIMFNVYFYNVQPGVAIDYETGNNWLDESVAEKEQPDDEKIDYILNTNTGKFHEPNCRSVKDMADHNKLAITATREEMLEAGYSPCGNCRP